MGCLHESKADIIFIQIRESCAVTNLRGNRNVSCKPYGTLFSVYAAPPFRSRGNVKNSHFRHSQHHEPDSMNAKSRDGGPPTDGHGLMVAVHAGTDA